MKKILLFVAFAAAVSPQAVRGRERVRNVIFLIGDGMGLPHAQLAMMRQGVPQTIERAQYIGLCKTHSANNSVTDSAAGGTALATGVKTGNGAIGVDTAGRPAKNIAEYAREKGLSTGIVVTKDITDATSAVFMSHRSRRDMAAEIAEDIAASGVDLFIGGGRDNFERRKDGRNLTDSLRRRGYVIAYTMDEVKGIERGRLAAMLAPKNQKTMAEGRGDMLPEATAQALQILKNNNKKGFFLMVEGSMIDSGGHANDARMVTDEGVDFWSAVALAFDFADRNQGTLVVVTADHETGGLTLPSGNADFLSADAGIDTKFGATGHTAVMVPVYSYGAGAAAFSAVMDNTDIFRKMMAALRLGR